MNQSTTRTKESWTDGIAIALTGAKVETESFWEELKLSFTRFNEEATAPHRWALQCDSWLKHVNAFACIKCGQPADCDCETVPTNATRITFCFDHLDVLDGKFNLILTFNSLLLIAMNVLLNILLNLLSRPASPGVPTIAITGYRTFWIFVIFGVAFGISWLLITTICFFSLRRLVWGDLGRTSEKEHVKQLIIAVAKRTNKFRMAVPLTIVNVFLLLGAFVTVLAMRLRLG